MKGFWWFAFLDADECVAGLVSFVGWGMFAFWVWGYLLLLSVLLRCVVGQRVVVFWVLCGCMLLLILGGALGIVLWVAFEGCCILGFGWFLFWFRWLVLFIVIVDCACWVVAVALILGFGFCGLLWFDLRVVFV